MQFSPPPDLSSNRHLAMAALLVTFIAGIGLIWHTGSLSKSLGDPDDAMRLVLVRDLMSGRGWYDQLVMRLQPPVGTYLHWSRLLDGALAGVIWIFNLVLSPPAAEIAVRLVWPLLWIFPAVLCALVIARRLGGSLAIFVCATLLASNQQPFAEFMPGRIDHHNIQIVMIMIATACAMAGSRRSRWAVLAGASTGLGLAIGVETLPFHALIGVSYGLEAASGRDEVKTTRRYAIALLGSTLIFYCLQTPPWRWAMSFCDSIGLSLVVAIAAATCGLFALTISPQRISKRSRLMGLGLIALVTCGSYLAFDPHCIRGPLAAVDPRLRPFWFNMIDELQPLPVIIDRYHDVGIAIALTTVMMLAAALQLLIRQWPHPKQAALLAGSTSLLAIVAGTLAFRMESYVFWLGFPLLATGLSVIATRLWRGLMAPTVAACVLISPVGLQAMAHVSYAIVNGPSGSPAPQRSNSHCYDTDAYKDLADLKPGLVLADITMGPFILANTRHSVLAAPYHRMAWGILAAHDALSASAPEADLKIRTLKVDYLVECPSNPVHPSSGSIEANLASAKFPNWLEALSTGGQTLQIYRVRPEGHQPAR